VGRPRVVPLTGRRSRQWDVPADRFGASRSRPHLPPGHRGQGHLLALRALMARGSRGRLQSTRDSVILHDMKNLEFRLNLLLSNLEEHYGDPDFKRSVLDLLQSSLEKVDSVVDRWSAYRDAVLVKVPLDVNDLLQEIAANVRPRDGGRPR